MYFVAFTLFNGLLAIYQGLIKAVPSAFYALVNPILTITLRSGIVIQFNRQETEV